MPSSMESAPIRGFVPMAHRGGALLPVNLGIENTIAAFRNAWELGFRHLETDVHATRDGRLVVFHDVDLTRVTGHAGRIEDMMLDELQDLQIGGREPIPTLSDLLEALPHAIFNLDIKAAGATRPLVETLRAHGAGHRVVVGSFSPRRIREFRRMLPGVTTAVSPVGVAALSLRIPRLPGRGEVVFQVPMTARVGAVRVPVVSPGRIKAVHAAGRRIHVWTVDDPLMMHELIDWGVDGIITDRPDLLKGVLSDRGMWSTR